MKKYKMIYKPVIFVLILGLFLLLFSQIFVPKDNRISASMDSREAKANGILVEDKDTVDVLFVGNSEAYSAFDPMQIWHKTGIPSYVCATPRQKLNVTFDYVKKAYKNQKPKLVVLEANCIFDNNRLLSKIQDQIKNALPIFKYHNLWKKGYNKTAFDNVKYTWRDPNKGYWIAGKINPSLHGDDYMINKGEKVKISNANIDYVMKIKDYVESHGSKFMIVSVPSTKNMSYAKYIALKKFCEDYKIKCINYNLEDIGIDWTHDTRDKGDHLNSYGSTKLTNAFIEYLKKQDYLKDKRKNSKYKLWNEDYKRYKKKFDVLVEQD